MTRFAFAPDPTRTAIIDRDIRVALADSVTRVLDQIARLGLAQAVGAGAWTTALVETPRAPPQLWACYHDLVQAILRPDAEAVPALVAELLAMRPTTPCSPGTVVTLIEADLGAINTVRYKAIIDGDPARPLGLAPCRPDEVARLRDLMVEARSLLAQADTALLDEIDTLAHQIVLATGSSSGFGGAASVFLWGAVALNPDRVPDRITLVESLAHESAHALLFGLTLGADLTLNGADERYASPLRPDPRPIEGIVHATYVLARMNHALKRLRDRAPLTGHELTTVAEKIDRNAANYEAGLQTVMAHARFTPDGSTIFENCINAQAID